MTPAPNCPECGAPLPPQARRGLCPRCLLRQALEPPPPEPDPQDSADEIRVVLAEDGVAPLPFNEIGGYELLEELGHGGGGLVFRARDRRLGRFVAVKLIRAGGRAEPADLARFRTEAAAAARMQHPNIITVYEVGEQEGTHFYSMEYVAGRSLAEVLRAGPLAPREAARLMVTVAEAIQYAHDHGVLHRDLKPSNILLDAEQRPRVADFGLAKILQADSGMTVSGAVLGSPQYMPPEQARGGSAQVDARSDVYSLGAILYEVLTGRPPFSAATPLGTLKLVVEREPIAPRAFNPGLPRDLETICLKCLAKEPAARYPTAQDLAAELGRFLRGEPIRSRPVNLAERAWRWCRRKPTLSALAAVVALSPIIIISILLIMGRRVALERNKSLAQLYVSDVALAARALDSGDCATAWRALAAHLAPGADPVPATQPLGFEWRYLWNLAQGEARVTFPAHRSLVNAVAYSADGRYAASASADGTAILWDAVKEQPLRRLPETNGAPLLRAYTDQLEDFSQHQSQVLSASFTANGQNLLTGISGPPEINQAMVLWDADSGRRLWTLSTNRFDMALCSPTDPNLALALPSYPRTNLALIDLAAGRLIRTFNDGRSDAVCFSPDGRLFARWNREPRRVSLQRVPDGKITAWIDSGRPYIIAMAFTPDGRTLALGNMMEGSVDLFDVATQQPAGRLVGGRGRLEALAISLDGHWLASGAHDAVIRLWDLPSRTQARQLTGHRGAVQALAFSPDSQRLLSGGHDGTVRFWDVTPPPQPAPITNVFNRFAFSPDGSRVLTQDTNDHVRLWHLPDRQLLREWEAPAFQAAVCTAEGEWLLAAIGRSNEPICLRLGTSSNLPKETMPLRGIASACSAMALTPDGSTAVTGHDDGTVACWQVNSRRLLQKSGQPSLSGSERSRVSSLTLSLDGQLLAAASFDAACLRTWRLSRQDPIGARSFRARYPMPVAVSPDGTAIATSGSTQGFSVNLWEAQLQSRLLELRGHLDIPTAIAFSPDGQTLATGAADGQLKLWHLPTQREALMLPALGKGVWANYLAFSANGDWLGAADNQGVLHLYYAPHH